jgi:hypothetical protein
MSVWMAHMFPILTQTVTCSTTDDDKDVRPTLKGTELGRGRSSPQPSWERLSQPSGLGLGWPLVCLMM